MNLTAWPLLFSSGLLVVFPTPVNLSYIWSLGSLLGISLVVQLLTGLMLVLVYSNNVLDSFNSVDYLSREINYGWLIRSCHLNGASLLFALLYAHMCRGVWYISYKLAWVWVSGSVLLVMIIAAAFMGYVLPWGQMSLWGATVITNLISVVPFVGNIIVTWVWGGFSVGGATLNLLFILHYIVPLLIIVVLFVHLINLHTVGSTSTNCISSSPITVRFHSSYSAKDSLNITILVLLIILSCISPWSLGDVDNWVAADPMVSPVHINPEWYFLWAYAILRCVPNKLGGTVAIGLALLVIIGLCVNNNYSSIDIQYFHHWCVTILLTTMVVLTWLGGCPVEYPYLLISQLVTILYFTIVIVIFIVG